jgi:hypothetical protein
MLRASLSGFHLNSNTANGSSRGIEDASKRLRCHINDETSLPVPRLKRFHKIVLSSQLLRAGPLPSPPSGKAYSAEVPEWVCRCSFHFACQETPM